MPSPAAPLSIVTAARGRRQQLARTAAAISRHGWHREHLIVDWSSEPPIARAELPADPRIRLLRVEGEAQWWLSRAYNHGFRQARGPWILKCDADALLDESFFQALEPQRADLLLAALPGGLSAERHYGRWGLFCVRRQALEAVGGFEPHLFGWGYDDVDLIERLFEHGCSLAALPQAGLHDLPHSDAERLGHGDARPPGRPWLDRLRLEASLEANRQMAARRRGHLAPGFGDPGPDLFERLPAAVLEQRRRALLSGLLKRLIGRYRHPLVAALPAAWLPGLLRAAGLSDRPAPSTTPAAPPPGPGRSGPP